MKKPYRGRHRHADIKRLLKQQAAPQAQSALVAALDAALNAVNAMDALGEVAKRPPARMQMFGPKAIKREAWAAVVVWGKPPKVHAYKTLTLLGIWALIEPSAPEQVILRTGTRQLVYSAAMYSPEAYFYQIQRDFSRYYGSNAPPPTPPATLHQAQYTPDNRLQLRRDIAAVLMRWRSGEGV